MGKIGRIIFDDPERNTLAAHCAVGWNAADTRSHLSNKFLVRSGQSPRCAECDVPRLVPQAKPPVGAFPPLDRFAELGANGTGVLAEHQNEMGPSPSAVAASPSSNSTPARSHRSRRTAALSTSGEAGT